MNQNLTDITVILDRSGSMSCIRDDTVGGLNNFVDQQKKLPGEANFTLVLFDDRYERPIHCLPLAQVPPLDFVPRGWTALLDAIGRTVNETGDRLRNMSPSCRPSKVIMVIITDGLENRSQEFTKSQINSMIELQRNNYQWEFVFLGANQDAITVGASLGIPRSSAMNFAATPRGVGELFCSTSDLVGNYRSTGQNTGYTVSDRAVQVAEGAKA